MADLIEQIRSQLEDWNYRIESVTEQSVCFEDATIIGEVIALETFKELRSEWKPIQDRFFNRYAPELRRAGAKSLNVVLMFLVKEEGSTTLQLELENDFVAARKIVRTNVTKARVLESMWPLAPIQNIRVAVLSNPESELKEQSNLSDSEFDAVMNDDDEQLYFQRLARVEANED